MHPLESEQYLRLRRERLLAEAAAARAAARAARLPVPSRAERVAARRRALGYRLVEAGLRLAVGSAPAAASRSDLPSTPAPPSP
jgi:hypothetical protein